MQTFFNTRFTPSLVAVIVFSFSFNCSPALAIYNNDQYCGYLDTVAAPTELQKIKARLNCYLNNRKDSDGLALTDSILSADGPNGLMYLYKYLFASQIYPNDTTSLQYLHQSILLGTEVGNCYYILGNSYYDCISNTYGRMKEADSLFYSKNEKLKMLEISEQYFWKCIAQNEFRKTAALNGLIEIAIERHHLEGTVLPPLSLDNKWKSLSFVWDGNDCGEFGSGHIEQISITKKKKVYWGTLTIDPLFCYLKNNDGVVVDFSLNGNEATISEETIKRYLNDFKLMPDDQEGIFMNNLWVVRDGVVYGIGYRGRESIFVKLRNDIFR